MRDFTCLGENGVQVPDFSSSSANRAAQNLVTRVYQCKLRGKSCFMNVTWSKNLMGQGFCLSIDNQTNRCLCKVEIKPWLFTKKKGSKTLEADSCKIDVYWDLSSAKFGSGPEPLEGFYVGVVFDKQMILLLGDMKREALKKTGASPSPSSAVLVSKREHIFGKKCFKSKAQFHDNGRVHDLVIECETCGTNDPFLVIRVDSKPVMQVKRLQWKFRGNHTIFVDGLEVEVFWDVHNWLFEPSLGNALFMFKNNVRPEKLWASQSLCNPQTLNWSWSQRFEDSRSHGLGFCLFLYAWKSE